MSQIFSRLLIRCFLSFIVLSLRFSHFTCKANRHNISKLCFLTHSFPFPRLYNNIRTDFKLFDTCIFLAFIKKDFDKNNLSKREKVIFILVLEILLNIIKSWINQLKVSRNEELQCVISLMKNREVPVT